ncbi:GTPase Era, mitochondrial [Pogona vitticeps]
MAAAAAWGLARRVSRVWGLAELRAWRARGKAPGVRSGLGAGFLNKALERPVFLPACLYKSDSALGHILGFLKEQEKPCVGQHAPPVSAFQEEHEEVLEQHPDQPDNPKVLKIAIIGAPNAGKSTLSNQLLGRKVFPVSQKVHTTRQNALGVITKEDTQLIILDTPGLTTPFKRKRHHLEDSLLYDPFRSLKEADLVVVVVDVSDTFTQNRLHPQVLKALHSVPEIPSILVLNKVDLLKKRQHLLHLVTKLTEGMVHGKAVPITSRLKARSSPPADDETPKDSQALETYTNGMEKPRDAEASHKPQTDSISDPQAASVVEEGDTAKAKGPPKGQKKKAQIGWPHFKEVFMLAAVYGEEVETLKRYLLQQARLGPWRFHSEVLTDQSPQEVCNNVIREKLLEYLPKEVPYSVVQEQEVWSEGPSGELVIVQNLVVQKKSHLKMLLGHEGELLNRVVREAGHDLMNTFLCDVHLKLSVKLQK